MLYHILKPKMATMSGKTIILQITEKDLSVVEGWVSLSFKKKSKKYQYFNATWLMISVPEWYFFKHVLIHGLAWVWNLFDLKSHFFLNLNQCSMSLVLVYAWFSSLG